MKDLKNIISGLNQVADVLAAFREVLRLPMIIKKIEIQVVDLKREESVYNSDTIGWRCIKIIDNLALCSERLTDCLELVSGYVPSLDESEANTDDSEDSQEVF